MVQGEQAQLNNPGETCKNISMIKLIEKKNKKWSAYKRGQLLKLGIILFSVGITPRYFTCICKKYLSDFFPIINFLSPLFSYSNIIRIHR